MSRVAGVSVFKASLAFIPTLGVFFAAPGVLGARDLPRGRTGARRAKRIEVSSGEHDTISLQNGRGNSSAVVPFSPTTISCGVKRGMAPPRDISFAVYVPGGTAWIAKYPTSSIRSRAARCSEIYALNLDWRFGDLATGAFPTADCRLPCHSSHPTPTYPSSPLPARN